jgi:hypothetical protein
MAKHTIVGQVIRRKIDRADTGTGRAGVRIGAAPITLGPVAVAVVLLFASLLSACDPEPEASSVDLRSVERRIEDVLTLHTFEHSYRSIVYFGEQRRFLFMDTMDRQVLFSIDVRVQAGMDLTEGVEIRRVLRDGDTAQAAEVPQLFVSLPAARILLVDADEESIREYFETDRGGDVGLLEYGREIENAKNSSRQAAISDGILREAEANARVIVREFLDLAGFERVEIRVRPREDEDRDGEEQEDELRG